MNFITFEEFVDLFDQYRRSHPICQFDWFIEDEFIHKDRAISSKQLKYLLEHW